MDLDAIDREARADLGRAASLADIEALQSKYLGRKDGRLTSILRNLGTLSPEEKKKVGQRANELRVSLETDIAAKRQTFESDSLQKNLAGQKIDLSLPGDAFVRGTAHPILSTIREICDIFRRLGFSAVEGPEIETDQNNFTDLNIPANHPARDMHDTFYVEPAKGDTGAPWVLRTHTSPVQIRVMKQMSPPVRVVSPGRVFRHEATDATHAAVFHQVEGLAVDENISFADLKATLAFFAEEFFGPKTRVRFSPSYFPFVEPGAQMEVSCFACGGTGRVPTGDACSICKTTGWIELLGAGMVHPQVLRNVGYDPARVTGFAFGMGVERLLMTRAQVRDIRAFLESDIRFLGQFQ